MVQTRYNRAFPTLVFYAQHKQKGAADILLYIFLSNTAHIRMMFHFMFVINLLHKHGFCIL